MALFLNVNPAVRTESERKSNLSKRVPSDRGTRGGGARGIEQSRRDVQWVGPKEKFNPNL